LNPNYRFVAGRAHGRCEYCLAPQFVFNFSHEVDHIFPPGEGGTDDPSNLALACRACNVFKGNRTTGIDETNGREVRLFHPRTQIWSDHFAFDPTSLRFVGRTATGRATIARLDLNHEFQIAARRFWIEMNLFP
jgi:hypothetical protein